MKVCSCCKILKPETDYVMNVSKTGKGQLRGDCKMCNSIRRKALYEKRKDIVLLKNKKYILSRGDYKKEYDKKRYYENKQKINKQHLERYHKRKNTDVNYRIKRSIRSRLYFALKNGQKCDGTMELIGCSIEELKKHIESKFKEGMSWDNYGKWHIDHIIPCSKFDLSKPEQQRICFKYTNLQPLWGIENILKSNKIYKEYYPEILKTSIIILKL